MKKVKVEKEHKPKDGKGHPLRNKMRLIKKEGKKK